MQLAKTHKLDLVLMDIDLPEGMDGIETASIIKSTFGIPSIFITALTDPLFIDRARHSEPAGYLVKPINKLSLHGSIQIGIQQHALASDLQASLEKVKLLTGLLPICSHCNKIKNEQNQWEKLERYISAHSEADFSHGICPDCQKKYYSD